MIDAINEQITKAGLKDKASFTLMKSGRVSIVTQGSLYVEFSKGGIGEMLGFDPGRHFGYVEGQHNPDLTGGIYGFYVYSDLILPQSVGDTYAPLLRVVPTSINTEESTSLIYIYNSPDYYPVRQSTISSVEVDIRTDWGERFSFSSGKTLVKLHLRKVEE